ncbi:MAG: hypothetical protein HY319_04240 [Armatimonadetes bacterium]|nr:hypothetical protein [Armatimonadota bacterium]
MNVTTTFPARGATIDDARAAIHTVKEQVGAASDDFVRSSVAGAAEAGYQPVLDVLDRFGWPTEEGNSPTLEIIHNRVEAASAAAHSTALKCLFGFLGGGALLAVADALPEVGLGLALGGTVVGLGSAAGVVGFCVERDHLSSDAARLKAFAASLEAVNS